MRLLFIILVLGLSCNYRVNTSNKEIQHDIIKPVKTSPKSCIKKQKNNDEIVIELLNDSLFMPEKEFLKCSDTLYFKICNRSEKVFVFIFYDSLFYFNNNDIDQFDTVTTRPSEGINLRFLDKDNFSLSTYSNEFYKGDRLQETDLLSDHFIKILHPKQTQFVKAILKFPNYILSGEWEQRIIHMEKAKTVKIVFEPDIEKFKYYKSEISKMIKEGFYPLEKKAVFRIPVSFKCDNNGD